MLDLHIVDVNAVDPVLCRTYYFRTCNCRPNNKRQCRPKSVDLMDGSRLMRGAMGGCDGHFHCSTFWPEAWGVDSANHNKYLIALQ